ncbi:hypothetical protein Zmor_004461, partial [Zophobas morio]
HLLLWPNDLLAITFSLQVRQSKLLRLLTNGPWLVRARYLPLFQSFGTVIYSSLKIAYTMVGARVPTPAEERKSS